MAFAKAKTELIAFLRQAPKDPALKYTFKVPLMSHDDAIKFVHRMRVELSRFRTDIQLQGKALRPFKMLIDKIEDNNTFTYITLQYKNTVGKKILADVNEIFDVISTGGRLINEREARNLPSKPLNFGTPLDV